MSERFFSSAELFSPNKSVFMALFKKGQRKSLLSLSWLRSGASGEKSGCPNFQNMVLGYFSTSQKSAANEKNSKNLLELENFRAEGLLPPNWRTNEYCFHCEERERERERDRAWEREWEREGHREAEGQWRERGRGRLETLESAKFECRTQPIPRIHEGTFFLSFFLPLSQLWLGRWWRWCNQVK